MFGGHSIRSGSRRFHITSRKLSLANLSNRDEFIVDAAGNLYIAQATANVIKKVTPAGVATTVTGTGRAVLWDYFG